MYIDDTPRPGGIKRTYYMTSQEFFDMLPFKMPDYTPEQLLVEYKRLIDKTPDHWLINHLRNAIVEENYELAAYIRDVANTRGVVLDV